jgi:bifunctional non-homologous end joining protein LigD
MRRKTLAYHPRMVERGARLATFRAKRSPDRTPEPMGAGAERPRLFVVQQHAARRLHFDLRLELDGVLLSWAVPKGPSYDPADKQLAVATEDHPVEYADFEGTIPKGNYGAGAMIVWDRGRWVSHGDPRQGFIDGKLLFDLHGHKLRGRWTLVKMKKTEREWLLIKERDEWATRGGRPLAPGSVLSGLTIEELAQGRDRAAEARGELARLGAPRRALAPEDVRVMLAERLERPFSRPGWLFELKYDGFRLVAGKRPAGARSGGPTVALVYRSGHDATRLFPDLQRAVAALPGEGVVLDGEVVVLDEEGRPSFQRLQQRTQLTRPADVERAAVELPATYFAFDLLACEGYDARPLPLVRRKELLRGLLPPAGPVRFADHVEARGEDLFREVRRLGVEGIVAKRADAPYRAGRTADWIKLRAEREDDFVVVGYTAPGGSRSGFGALHLAWHEDGELVYAGRVGSGFSEELLADLHRRLSAKRRRRPACGGAVPQGAGHVWVRPELVAAVRYHEVTGAGQLRKPVFLRLRDDKPPAECRRPADRDALPPPDPPAKQPAAAARRRGRAAARAALPRAGKPPAEPPLHNLDKVFWPGEGITKGELLAYYRAVAPALLPYLRDRPVVLTRYPDGVAGKSFFQKNAPPGVPDWVRTIAVWSEDSQREIEYVVCDDLATLLYLVDLGTIPLHVWASRLPRPEAPDWCVLDLDPKGAPFDHVVEVALELRTLCRDIGLEPVVKTSGSTGLHVLLPLGAQCTHEQSRQLGEVLARLVVRRLPAIATITRVVQARGGRVYVDYVQNGWGRLLVAPFSVRPLPGAPVSTPLRWSEVEPGLDITRFTIRTVPERLRRRRADPLAPLLTARPDLTAALADLAARLPE